MARIGEILIQKGLLTQEQLEKALEESKLTGKVIGKILIDLQFITEIQLLKTLGEQLGLPFYDDLVNMEIGENVIKSVPMKFVWHYKIIPISLAANVLTIAVSDPMAIWFMEDLKLHLGFNIERVLSTEQEIMAAIRKHYGFGAETVEEILEQKGEVKDKQKEKPKPDIIAAAAEEKSAQDASVVKLVDQILEEAISSRATDVHIEAFRDKVRTRCRIDGVLYDMNVSEQVKHLYQAIVSRVKIISSLNVVEKRLPQDGRAIMNVAGKQIDLRISVIPSIYGEGVVIRILPVQHLFNLRKLGFSNEAYLQIEEMMKKPFGIIFLTGPTGSGKTTTLYSCLSMLNNNTVKIITIEDPVEYELNGVMQIHVKPNIGFTFASALRSILRHDPDIMMVGEVRDLETAELAIRTALTGHRIFSTLHTNDAASGATRLLDIGIEPYLITSSVNAFISQRLVRMICPKCKEERKDKQGLPKIYDNITLFKGKGCEECNFIGYKGRTVIYEILPIGSGIQALILQKASAVDINKKAREIGFKSLGDVGIEKIKQGITTPEEVMQVAKIEQ
ncbi:MAG: ATPase, T2SS/T4P/T4SS family [Candidatus Omnitrophota bacterium]